MDSGPGPGQELGARGNSNLRVANVTPPPGRLPAVRVSVWRRLDPRLFAVGTVLYLGIWADKFLFWSHPDTARAVIGALNASPIYDWPIFVAYLWLMPGMAAFLIHVETESGPRCRAYYDAWGVARPGRRWNRLRAPLAESVRAMVAAITHAQGIATVLAFVAAPGLLRVLGLPPLHLGLLYVDVVAAGLQVLLVALFSVLFYLDKVNAALKGGAVFLVANTAFTALSLELGAPFYGYGYALALGIAVTCVALERKFARLEFEAYLPR